MAQETACTSADIEMPGTIADAEGVALHVEGKPKQLLWLALNLLRFTALLKIDRSAVRWGPQTKRTGFAMTKTRALMVSIAVVLSLKIHEGHSQSQEILMVTDVAYSGGAKCDGTTNDTAAIQAAIDAAARKTLQFPNGRNCIITRALSISSARTRILGYGATITQTAAGKAGIDITASNVTIEGLTMAGAQRAIANIDETAIHALGTNDGARIADITVLNTTVHNWGFEGIRFDYVNGATARGNHVYNIVYGGIQGRHTNDFDFSHNRVHDIGPGSSGVSVGITVTGTVSQASSPKQGVIENNTISRIISSGGECINLEPAEHATVSGNSLTDCYLGIADTSHPAGGVGKYNTITGNTVVNRTLAAANRKAGILVNGIDGRTPALQGTITRNTIRGYGTNSAGNYGAIHLVYADGFNVSGNDVLSSAALGIYLVEAVSNSSIRSNRIHGMDAFRADSAIRVLNGGMDETVIEDNDINLSVGAVGINVATTDNRLLCLGPNAIKTSGIPISRGTRIVNEKRSGCR